MREAGRVGYRLLWSLPGSVGMALRPAHLLVMRPAGGFSNFMTPCAASFRRFLGLSGLGSATAALPNSGRDPVPARAMGQG